MPGGVYFTTRRGEQVTARVASSFISEEQALRNLETGSAMPISRR